MARPAQITQNNKFAKSLQYLKKEVGDEVDFLCNDHHSFTVSLQHLKEELSCEVMFCLLINKKIFYKLIILFLMGLARHA